MTDNQATKIADRILDEVCRGMTESPKQQIIKILKEETKK